VPARERLESVRDLPARFPDAGLVPVSVARTPLLDRIADETGATRVHLALESLQVTGSFKVRGALVVLAAHLAAGRRTVVSVSAGNHGAGLAYAAKVLGVRATICVPRASPEAKRAKIANYGAELIVVDSDSYDDAEIVGKKLALDRGHPFVSAYDDEDVVLGNGASLGFDIVRALGRSPTSIVAPFGGGGLSTGLAWGTAPATRVFGAQSEVSCAMALSLEKGAAIERLIAAEPTLAEGLEGGIAASAFERARNAVAGVVVIRERAIAQAMAYAWRDLGLVLEGSAAVALVPILGGLPPAMRGGDVVAVLTGRNVDKARLDAALSC
jgi:threonine dehydratase